MRAAWAKWNNTRMAQKKEVVYDSAINREAASARTVPMSQRTEEVDTDKKTLDWLYSFDKQGPAAKPVVM